MLHVCIDKIITVIDIIIVMFAGVDYIFIVDYTLHYANPCDKYDVVWAASVHNPSYDIDIGLYSLLMKTHQTILTKITYVSQMLLYPTMEKKNNTTLV